MMTNTFLRVKRKHEQSPEDAFALYYKRRKFENEENVPSIFVYQATVPNQDNIYVNNILDKYRSKRKNEFEDDKVNYKKRLIEKVSNEIEHGHISKQNNYRDSIMSCYSNENNENIKIPYNIIDLHIPEDEELSDQMYAYDLYKCLDEDFDISVSKHLEWVLSFESNLVNEDSSLSDNDPYDSEYVDEYPDSESDKSINRKNSEELYDICDDSEPEFNNNDEELNNIFQKIHIGCPAIGEIGQVSGVTEDPNSYCKDLFRFGTLFAKSSANYLSEILHRNNSNDTTTDSDED